MSKKLLRRSKKSTKKNALFLLPEKKMLLASSGLFKPMTPFEQRMADLTLRLPSADPSDVGIIQSNMSIDISFQLKLKEIERTLPTLIANRLRDGSELQLSKLFRTYFVEYLHRLNNFGPEFFPTSFNVVESFMSFNRDYLFFDIHKEIEHLLYINDYFDWYNSGELPKHPQILNDILTEGVIYSYEMVSDSSSLRIQGDSQQVFAGIALIRHDYEVSCLLLAGENPPLHSDDEILKILSVNLTQEKEGLKPAPDLSIKDRYLEGYPGYAKVIVLTRFDLRTAKHDVRYVNLDLGQSFQVLTDDPIVFRNIQSTDIDTLKQNALAGLNRYNDLFAALTSMIYLPAFFIARADKIKNLRVATRLFSERNDKKCKDLIAKIGADKCIFHRNIKCMPLLHERIERHTLQVEPPELEFSCDGFWKPIGPLDIGEDKEGNAIVGRTWVSRHESWSAKNPSTFMLQQNNIMQNGPDPGFIYVIRSPSHDKNVYKIGLTRRTSEIRVAELSSNTATPLPFGVLANWNVGNCSAIEREAHRRLAAYRINPNREYFLTELSKICSIINSIVKEN